MAAIMPLYGGVKYSKRARMEVVIDGPDFIEIHTWPQGVTHIDHRDMKRSHISYEDTRRIEVFGKQGSRIDISWNMYMPQNLLCGICRRSAATDTTEAFIDLLDTTERYLHFHPDPAELDQWHRINMANEANRRS